MRENLSIFTIILALIVFIGFMIIVNVQVISYSKLKKDLEAQQQQLELVTIEYKKQLAINKQLQIERDKAKEAISYKNETPAQYNANLMIDFIKFLGESKEMSNQAKKLNAENPEDLEKYAENLQKTLDKGVGILGRIILRNTEPEPEKPTNDKK